MNRLVIGGCPIVYPTPETVFFYKNAAGEHLRKHFEPGIYRAPNDINAVLKCVLDFFESQIDDLLRPYLCRAFLQGILFQYKLFQKIYQSYIANKLNHNDKVVYEKMVAGSYGRAVKFIAERIVLLKDLDVSNPPEDGFEEVVSALFCCAQEVVEFSMRSDLVHGVAPLASEAKVHPAGSDLYLELGIADENLKSCMETFSERWRTHVKEADRIIAEFANKTSPEFYSVATFGKRLDQRFSDALGFSFTNAVNALVEPLASISEPGDGLPVVFLDRTTVLRLAGTNSGLKSEQIESIFDGFVITAAGIATEGRAFWDAKSEYRARRRGIFEVYVGGERNYAWCREIYGEALHDLEVSATYQDVPLEWHHEETEKAISGLSNDVGKWFEKLVENELRKLGWKVVSSRNWIGRNKHRLQLPGEIDLIAYLPSEKLLVVGECKRIRGGTEPAFFYDEIQKFTRGSRPFLDRLNMKADFIKKEMDRVVDALQSEWETEVVPQRFARTFITRRPSIVACLIDVPCVSLDELVRSYSSLGRWNYGTERLS